MLEYKDHIKIIDYKLKNIDDENYIKQQRRFYFEKENFIIQFTNAIVMY